MTAEAGASSSRPRETPPLYTLLCEIVGWTLDRAVDIPKSPRFTFGQRPDNLSLAISGFRWG